MNFVTSRNASLWVLKQKAVFWDGAFNTTTYGHQSTRAYGPHGSGTLCNACGSKWKNGRIAEGPDGILRLVDAPLARKLTGPNGSKKPRLTKAGLPDVAFPISYEQKRELSIAIERMAEQGSEQLANVVDIIRCGMPAIGGDSDEIERTWTLWMKRLYSTCGVSSRAEIHEQALPTGTVAADNTVYATLGSSS